MFSQESNSGPLQSNNGTDIVRANKKTLIAVVAGVLIVSFLAGLAGGFIAGRQLKIGGKTSTTQQTLTLNEDSGIIEVVKQSSPAVVSIVISKDLSKIFSSSQSDNADPFSSDPFLNSFFSNNNSNSQNWQQSSDGSSSQSSGVQEVGAGSGFFVSADGLIVTNKHVVTDTSASYTVLTADGKKYDAKVVATDPVNDLAIVKIDIQNAPYLKFADSDKIQIGQRVIAIGNSLGLYQNTVTSGIVSGKGRKITAGSEDGSEQLSGVIQTDAAINPGNSGGPLLDITGAVIGMNTAIDEQGQLVGFAIPAKDVVKAVASYQKNGKISRAYLGVRYVVISQDLADSEKLPYAYGALVVRGSQVTDLAVTPGSPADKAGLVENDIILEVNGQKIYADNSLSDLLKTYNVGDSVSLKVYHKGEIKTVTVVLAESK